MYRGLKFKIIMESKDAPKDMRLRTLKHWCKEYHDYNLAPPYPGGSYGNLSFRLKKGKNEFVITGSRIGLKDCLTPECFVKVRDVDLKKGIVYASGSKEPSSESMLHYAIYNARPDINAIFHGHSGRILKFGLRMWLCYTSQERSCGTLSLVKEVLKVLDRNFFIVMKGHGFLSLGKTIDEAGELSLSVFKACASGREGS